jgi:hypothetical protein
MRERLVRWRWSKKVLIRSCASAAAHVLRHFMPGQPLMQMPEIEQQAGDDANRSRINCSVYPLRNACVRPSWLRGAQIQSQSEPT